MRAIIYCIMFITCSLIINAQTIQVIDISNLQGISYVSVLKNGQQIGITNLKGNIQVTANPFDTLEFRHISYEIKKESFQNIVAQKGKIYLKPMYHPLNEVVISANRFETERQSIAQPIQVIGQKELQLHNAQTSADAVQTEGYAFVQKSQMGGGSPIIRGFEANKILLVVDGIRMNNAIYRGGHLQNIITVDPNSLQKMEILYGPGSVMYGSDALGGTIYLQTKNPALNDTTSWTTSGEVMARTASANFEKTGHVSLNIANNRIASLTTFTYSDFDDLRQGNNRNPFYGDWGKRLFFVERIDNKDSILNNMEYNIQKGSAYSQYDMMQKLLWKAYDYTEILANVQYSTSSNISRYDRLTQTQNGLPRFAEWYYGPQKRLLTYLRLNYQKPTTMFDKFSITPSYQNIEESRHDRKFNNKWLNHRIEKLDILSINADFIKNFSTQTFTYGLDVSTEKVDSKAHKENILTGEQQPLDTRYPDGGSTMDRYSFYLSHKIKITEKLCANEGIRFNYSMLNATINDTTFYKFPFSKISQQNQALSGNIGLIYMPFRRLSVQVNYANGYRTPNVDDLSKIFETTPGNVIMPNEKLRPEHTHTFDLGVRIGKNQDIAQALFNGYYTLYDNAITTEPGTFNGQDSIMYDGQLSRVLMNVNKNEAYLYGVTAQLNIKLNEWLRFNGSVTYTYGRIKTDTTDYPLDHIPPVYGKCAFMYISKKIQSEFNLMFNGWKFVRDYNMFGEDNFSFATEHGMPAWMTLNLLTSYSINQNFQLNAGVENILDQNYRQFASNISAAGRNFKLSLRFCW